MSGGAYNYIEFRTEQIGSDELPDLIKIWKKLEEYPNLQKFRAYLKETITDLLRVKSRLKLLGPLFHAVEWVASADWGKERLEQFDEIRKEDLPDGSIDFFEQALREHDDDE